MPPRLHHALLPLALAVLTWSAPASANDPATATMLFNEARRLVASGSYADACPKFEESQRLDPGIGTQFNLADCYEHVGRSASAWALFQDVAAAAKGAGQATRAQIARQRAAALERRLSKLTINAPKNAIGLEVRRNGELLGSVLWGNAIPVDPGSYTLEASAPGKKRWSSVASVGPNGAQVTITIPTLESAEPAVVAVAPSAPSPATASHPSTSTSTEAGLDHPKRSGAGQRTAGFVVAGVGLVGVGVGTAFGLQSFAKHSDYVSHCNGSLCDATGVSGHADAVTAGNVSTAAFIAGGALVAAGAVLWLTAPKGSPSTGVRAAPLVGANAAGISIGGGWQ